MLVHRIVAEIALRTGQTMSMVVIVVQELAAVLAVHQVTHLGGQQLLLIRVRRLFRRRTISA